MEGGVCCGGMLATLFRTVFCAAESDRAELTLLSPFDSVLMLRVPSRLDKENRHYSSIRRSFSYLRLTIGVRAAEESAQEVGSCGLKSFGVLPDSSSCSLPHDSKPSTALLVCMLQCLGVSPNHCLQ